jgi:hypothetical protein
MGCNCFRVAWQGYLGQVNHFRLPLPLLFHSRITRNALRFLFLTNHRLELSPHISPDGNALRFSYRTNEIRKPKRRNASRFRRLTLLFYS